MENYVKIFNITNQKDIVSGLMNSISRDIVEGQDGMYMYGRVPATATKTNIHNKIVILRGELHRLDEMLQEV